MKRQTQLPCVTLVNQHSIGSSTPIPQLQFLYQPCNHVVSLAAIVKSSQTHVNKLKNELYVFQCPPWFVWDNGTGSCNSGPPFRWFIHSLHDLSPTQTSIMECYCMTEEDGVLTVGFCLHMCLALQYTALPCSGCFSAGRVVMILRWHPWVSLQPMY